MVKLRNSKLLDKFGICMSGLCLVHCLLTPVIIMLFPALRTSTFFHELFHQIVGTAVILSVFAAVSPHCHKHGHKDILITAILGMVAILTALLLGHELSPFLENTLTISGSILLIIAHLKNIKVRHKKCDSDHQHNKEYSNI